MPAFQDHHHLFERGISRPLANAVDGHLSLPRPVHDAGNGVGGGHPQIVVAVRGNHHLVNPFHILHQIFDFRTEFLRKAIARGIGNVDHRGTRLDHRFDHPRQIFVVGTTGIFGIEFHILHQLFRIFHSLYRPLKDLVGIAVELVVNVVKGSADSGVYPLLPGIPQGIGSHVDILPDGPREAADDRPGHRLGNLHH